MKLLSPKRANQALKEQARAIELKTTITNKAMDAAMKKFAATRNRVDEEETKLWEAHKAFIDDITEDIKTLTAEVNELEQRKAEALKPIELKIEQADELMDKATSFMDECKEKNAQKEEELNEKSKEIQKKMDKLTDMMDVMAEREYMVTQKEGYARDRLRMADEILKKAEEKADSVNEGITLREAAVTERERAVKDRENAADAINVTLKKKQEDIMKDRLHLTSQIEAFNTAQNAKN